MINWDTLEDAYGPATNVGNLLQVASTHPTDENWKTLWSKLCHQGDIYTASYAAVPTLVEIAVNSSISDFNPILLVASIEFARAKGNVTKVPENLSENYFNSLVELKKYLNEVSTDSSDSTFKKSLAYAQAVLSGDLDVAEEIDSKD